MGADAVTVSLTKESFKGTEQAVLPKLWDVLFVNGRLGIVYRISVSIDEEGKGHKLEIKNWKFYKIGWYNDLRLWWLKLRVKYNLI
jgi:hypothetical protein